MKTTTLLTQLNTFLATHDRLYALNYRNDNGQACVTIFQGAETLFDGTFSRFTDWATAYSAGVIAFGYDAVPVKALREIANEYA